MRVRYITRFKINECKNLMNTFHIEFVMHEKPRDLRDGKLCLRIIHSAVSEGHGFK